MTQANAGRERWRAFDPDWYRMAYPIVDELLRSAPGRQPHDLYRSIGPVLGHSPNPYFCEGWYRQRYTVVAEQVRTGAVASGFDHYCREGHGRLAPHWLFDPDDYRHVLEAGLGRPFDPPSDGDLYDHFLRQGQFQGLSGHRLFDPSVYARLAPPDIVHRIGQDGPFTTFLHHCLVGGVEPVVSLDFDPAWYLDRYPRVATDIRDGRWTCALHHFLQAPEAAGFDPNPRFSEMRYRGFHLDVQAVVGDGGFRSGFDHFLRHGRQEERMFFPAGPAGEAVVGVPRPPAAISAGFPLRTARFADVTFLPAQRTREDINPWGHAALAGEGSVIDAFPSGDAWDGAGMALAQPVPGVHIYGGLLPDHYGHFLVDGLTRLWALREQPDLPVLWLWDPLLPAAPEPPWVHQLWELLGLSRHRHVVIREPIRVEQVILPDPGRQSLRTMHPKQAAALGVVPATGPGVGRRVWLSRRGLPSGTGQLEPQAEIETALQSRGWAIVRPEDLPVAQQVDLFATADVVAGCIGSAFHTALLCAEPRAHLLPVLRPGVDRALFDLVAEARGLRQTYIVPQTTLLHEGGSLSVAMVCDVGAVVEAITDAAA